MCFPSQATNIIRRSSKHHVTQSLISRYHVIDKSMYKDGQTCGCVDVAVASPMTAWSDIATHFRNKRLNRVSN